MCKKRKNQNSCLCTNSKKSILDLGKIAIACGLLCFLYSIPFCPVVRKWFSCMCLYNSITQQDFSGFYDTQISLLGTAIAAITIITAILEKRYLGASYKYWLFRGTVFRLTPQNAIAIMIINQVGGLFLETTGQFRAVALISFGICWGLFLVILYQVYICTIKVSRIFYKIRRKLLKCEKKGTSNDFCDSLYDKIRQIQIEDTHNSYLFEEIEIMIQLIIIYRKQLPNDKKTCQQKIETISNIIYHMIENEASIRAKTFTPSLPNEFLNKIKRELVVKTINKGNELLENSFLSSLFTYQNNKTAMDNLSLAIEKWCSLPATT